MPRLLRPSIPDRVKLLVVLRQLGEMWPSAVVAAALKTRTLAATLTNRLCILADLLDCEVADLHLDHDPALGSREKRFNRAGEHIGYKPDANDHEHLIYRVKQAHKIKTNIRGEHGQHPDRVLIVKNRRREKQEAEERQQRRRKTPFLVEKPQRRPRKKWSAPLRSANRWPPKGSQTFANKGVPNAKRK